MDESSHSDYSDVDYIPDTDGADSEGADTDVSLSSSPEKTRQRLQLPQLATVMADHPDKESSSTDSPDKESSTKRNAARKRMGSSVIPGKKRKQQKKRNTPLHPEKDSSSIVSPEKDKSSIEVSCTKNTQERRVYDKRNYCLYCSKPTAKIS